MDSDISKFLSRFHTGDDITSVFTGGCCYWFAVTLCLRFHDDSTLMYDQIANHFVARIRGRLYDITGDVTDEYNAQPWAELDDKLLKGRIIRDCIMF